MWAAKLGIVVDSIDIDVTGDLDVRGFFGLDESVRPGFSSVKVEGSIGPKPHERSEELTRVVERYCPVLDVLTAGVPVTSRVTYAG